MLGWVARRGSETRCQEYVSIFGINLPEPTCGLCREVVYTPLGLLARKLRFLLSRDIRQDLEFRAIDHSAGLQ